MEFILTGKLETIECLSEEYLYKMALFLSILKEYHSRTDSVVKNPFIPGSNDVDPLLQYYSNLYKIYKNNIFIIPFFTI
jgi:hypothetical protein